MEDIIEPTMDYDFSKLYFGPPTTLAGGAYFTRIMYNTNKTLFIQTPKSLTKQGFIKNGKKIYSDLMFDNNDTVFINWIENLEARCQELVYSKRDTWFETKLEKDDIESAFTSPFKIFKSGKYYLLRVNVKPNIKIYDEKDLSVPIETITSETNIISILEIQGLKFTSRNFQIEIELKQSMIVSPDPFLDECFIRKPTKKQSISAKQVEVEEEVEEDIIKKSEPINLDELIEKSVQDLAKNNDSFHSKSINTKKQSEPIDLEVSFDEHLEKDKYINNSTNTSTSNKLFELEEANIVLDVEDLETTEEIKEDPNILKEHSLYKIRDKIFFKLLINC
jgi:hypothetical protein